MSARKKIVIGLGNPGDEFENTYHNIGAMAIEAIAAKLGWKTHKGLFKFAVHDGMAFVVPLTFMNTSGAAAKEAMKKFGAKPEDFIVIHDESDLPVGKYKLSVGSGSAGHKGVQSIMDALRSSAFTRVRIGIRDPRERKRKKASEFVLKKISPKDRAVFREIFLSL